MARSPKNKEKAAIRAAEEKLQEDRDAAYKTAEKNYDKEMAPILLQVRAARAKAVAKRNAAYAEANAVYYNGIAKLRSVK